MRDTNVVFFFLSLAAVAMVCVFLVQRLRDALKEQHEATRLALLPSVYATVTAVVPDVAYERALAAMKADKRFTQDAVFREKARACVKRMHRAGEVSQMILREYTKALDTFV